MEVPSAAGVLIAWILLLQLEPRASLLLDEQCGMSDFQATTETPGPWTALLHVKLVIVCAGSLINDRVVLTAAHCLEPDLTVRLGNGGSRSDLVPEDYSVEVAIRHRQYDYQTRTNDIALLLLSAPVVYNEHIKPICIELNFLHFNDRPDQTSAEALGEFSGTAWGAAKQQYSTQDLRSILVRRLDPSACQDTQEVSLRSGQFCVGNPDAATVEGPAGGALYRLFNYKGARRYFLVGVGSFKQHDFINGRIYMDVLNSGDWIQKVMSLLGYQPSGLPTLNSADDQKSENFPNRTESIPEQNQQFSAPAHPSEDYHPRTPTYYTKYSPEYNPQFA